MIFLTIFIFAYLAPSRVSFGLIPKEDTLNPIVAMIFRNKCLKDLGCFYNGPPFYHPIMRPISLPPFDLEDMQTKFYLFTRSNRNYPYHLQLNDKSLEESPFDPSLPTKFLIHGFLSVLTEDDQRHNMKNAFLEQNDYNIIIVDWTKSNHHPYPQAVSNARVVGAQVAQMIRFLQDKRSISAKSVHMIGHSLGSHVAGWAGERIPHIGRITGLDPAGPYFIRSGNKLRLDTSDADFVDVIHTNSGDIALLDRFGFGIPDVIGHMDFFPNGGERQPGCKAVIINSTMPGMNITLIGDGTGLTYLMAASCDHSRCYDYFISSINGDCQYKSVQCDEFDDFNKGECHSKQTAIMGFPAKKNPKFEGKKLYLRTTGKPPYCSKDDNWV